MRRASSSIILSIMLPVFYSCYCIRHFSPYWNWFKATSQITMAQQQQHQLFEGLSFQIDNVTFSHHLASFNGIQVHHVIGGQGGPVVLLHGWPQSWYKWRTYLKQFCVNMGNEQSLRRRIIH